MRRLDFFLLPLLFGVNVARASPPKTVDECIDKHAEAQRQSFSNHLRAARDIASECTHAICPPEIQSECAGFVASLEPRLGSLIVRVRQGEAEVTTARVFVGEELLTERVGRDELEVDPGMLKVAVVLPDGARREATVLVAEGERGKRMDFSFPARAASDATSPNEQTTTTPLDTERPIPALVWVFGGLAVASAAGFATLGLHGAAREDALIDAGCRPFCAQDEVDAIRNEYIAADVLLGVSIASLATGAVIFFTRPEVPVSTTFDLHVRPGLLHAGGTLRF